MSSRWLSASLRSLVSYIGKGIIPKYVESEQCGSMVVLGQRCVRNQTVDYGQARLHDGAAKHVKNEKLVQQGDILINATGVGSAGRVAQVVEQPGQLCTTDGHVITLRASEGIDPYYLGYFLKSKQALIEQMAEGSTGQTEMNRNRLQDEIIVTYPEDPSFQRAIASIGLNLDSRVAINSRLNDYLFECCAAKMNDIVGVPSSTIKVDDCCELIYSGGTPSTKNPAYWNGDLPWLSSGETRSRFIIDTEKTITELGVMESSTKLAKTGDIVMASAGQGFTRGQTSMLFFDTYVNQSVVVMRPKKDYGAYLLLMLAGQYDNLRAWSDSTSTRGSMSGKLLKQFELPYFDANQAKELTEFAAPMFRMIENNMRESKVLAQARDVLLPKLMSGEIDLAKIEFPTQPNNHLCAG